METDQPVVSESSNLPESVVSSKPSNNKKKIFLIAGLVILGIILFGGGILAGRFLFQREKVESTPEIVETSSEEEKLYKLAGALVLKEGVIEKKTNGDWIELNKQDVIEESDVVRTGKDSRAVFELDDGSAIRLDELSEMTFSALDDEVILITQINGRIYHRVHPGSLVYNVKSLDVLATALGTNFSVTTDQETETTEVAVFENKVQVFLKGDEVVYGEAEEGEKILAESKTQKLAKSQITSQEQSQDFYQWNTALNEGEEYQKQEAVQEKTTTEKQTTSQTPSGNIVLAGVGKEDGQVYLSWTLTGSAPYGFKLVKSTNPNPEYPPREGDQFKYISANTTNYNWTSLTAGTNYHFRVGIYNGAGAIISYSNDISVSPTTSSTQKTTTKEESSSSSDYADSVTLSVSSSETGKAQLSWEIAGGNAPTGFKACYSTNANPTYPEDNCTWQDSGSRSMTAKNLSSGSTYHFRVGVYSGSGIKVYSNDVSVVVQ